MDTDSPSEEIYPALTAHPAVLIKDMILIPCTRYYSGLVCYANQPDGTSQLGEPEDSTTTGDCDGSLPPWSISRIQIL
jgi:hypothetical protein